MTEPAVPIALTPRLTRAEQITELIRRTRAVGASTLKVRIPFQIYAHDGSRNYANVRDTTWNLHLPADQITPEMIEQLIGTLDLCVQLIAREGSQAVLDRLTPPIPD